MPATSPTDRGYIKKLDIPSNETRNCRNENGQKNSKRSCLSVILRKTFEQLRKS